MDTPPPEPAPGQDAHMHPHSGLPGPTCPVCGTPVGGRAEAACPTCGLPAAGQAALVVDRIGATLHELARDREALLVTLRAAAAGRQVPAGADPAAAPWAPTTAAPTTQPPPSPSPSPPPPVAAPVPGRPARVRRRLSPQQVLLGLGALLLVAGALAFVAVAWTRLGVGFQSVVMLAVTSAACVASGWAARRGLRATEEALAAAGAALLAVDLGAAHALGLLGIDRVPLRLWTAVSCLVVVLAGVLLGRLTRTTLTWPLVALLAAQPVPLLLLPAEAAGGPAGVAVVLAVAGLDVGAVLLLRRALSPVAQVLSVLWTLVGILAGLTVAFGADPVDSWTTTAVLAGAGATALGMLRIAPLRARLATGPSGRLARALTGRVPDRWGGRRLPPAIAVTATASGVLGAALAGSLRTAGAPGPVLAAALGLALLTGAALLLPRTPVPGAGLLAGGTALALIGFTLLTEADRLRPLSALFLAAAVPAVVAAVRLPRLREPAAGTALLAPVAALLLAHEARLLPAVSAGLLLALIAAAAFALAAARAGQPEEWACAVAGTVAGAAAARTTTEVGAWGQLALQLAVVGVAAGCYALVAHRRPVAVVAVADLVVASWIAVAGAQVETPEAYTLPAAAGVLLLALPRLRARGRSWATEGAAVGVALVPSALVVVATPSALRLVLVVTAAAAFTVTGALAHRQAPFVIGAAALLFVVLGRLSPYAPLLPRWVTLATAGLLLLVVGATYERRRQQAREAVAWVAQMG